MAGETIVKIDGSYGEGGGQILRTALTLSAITGKSLEIFNIRAGRRDPGLKPQHLLSAMAAAAVTGGRLEHAEIESRILRFFPGPIAGGRYSFDVASIKASAGAAGLIFQTIVPILSFADGPSDICIRGGTHVPWSPPADYLEEIFIPAVARMGLEIDMAVLKFGFYPIGGGEIDVKIKSQLVPLKSINIPERGKIQKIAIVSSVANLPLSIAERQRNKALQRFQISQPTFAGFQIQSQAKEVPSPGRGTFVFIMAEFEKIRAGFIGLGAKGKRAEAVADEAVDEFLQYFNRSGALDPHLSDQMVLYMALADGESSFTTTRITNHLLTNIWIIEKFLPVRFEIKGNIGEKGAVTVRGAGFCRK